MLLMLREMYCAILVIKKLPIARKWKVLLRKIMPQ